MPIMSSFLCFLFFPLVFAILPPVTNKATASSSSYSEAVLGFTDLPMTYHSLLLTAELQKVIWKFWSKRDLSWRECSRSLTSTITFACKRINIIKIRQKKKRRLGSDSASRLGYSCNAVNDIFLPWFTNDKKSPGWTGLVQISLHLKWWSSVPQVPKLCELSNS